MARKPKVGHYLTKGATGHCPLRRLAKAHPSADFVWLPLQVIQNPLLLAVQDNCTADVVLIWGMKTRVIGIAG